MVDYMHRVFYEYATLETAEGEIVFGCGMRGENE